MAASQSASSIQRTDAPPRQRGVFSADMAPDPSQGQERRKLQQQPVSWRFLTGLFWAPAFPMLRALTRNMESSMRLRTIGAAIVVANFHAFWLINNPDLSDEALYGKSD